MDEEIIKRLYTSYLDEVFDVDKDDSYLQNFVINVNDGRCFFLNPSKSAAYDYRHVSPFKNGYSLVKDGGKENIINSDGVLLSSSWFTKVGEFRDGLFYVKNGDAINFIDTNGKLLFKEWKKNVSSILGFYSCGVAIIGYEDGHYSLVNKDGVEREVGEFDVDGFIGNYMVAKKRGESESPYYIINNKNKKTKVPYKYLKQISDELFIGSYDDVGTFYGVSNDKANYFIVDAYGNRVDDNTYDYVDVFSTNKNYTIVRNNGMYNLLGKDGKLLTDEWFSNIERFNNDLWLVEKDNKFNFIRNDGGFVSNNWFVSKVSLNKGFVVLECNKNFYIMDDNGFLHKEKYSSAKEAFESNKDFDSKSNRAFPVVDFSFNIVNYKRMNGEKIFENDENNFVKNSANQIIRLEGDKLNIYDTESNLLQSLDVHAINLGGADAFSIDFVDRRDCVERVKYEKKFRSYKYASKDDKKFSLLYRPLVDYGNFIICEVDDLYYLYSKSTNEYNILGKKSEIQLHNNYLSIKDKKYYIGDEDFIDISGIDFKNHLDVKKGITRVASLNEFRKMYRDLDFQEKISDEIESIRRQIALEEQATIKRRLEEEQERERQKVLDTKENLDDSLDCLADILKECSKYISEIEHLSKSGSKKKITVPKELLLIDNLDHLEINQIFMISGLLRYIDLSIIDFENVKVSSLDLSYTNARINPQTVYNKDMSNGKYRGLDFNMANFDGVNIENSDFSEATMDFAVGYNGASTK